MLLTLGRERHNITGVAEDPARCVPARSREPIVRQFVCVLSGWLGDSCAVLSMCAYDLMRCRYFALSEGWTDVQQPPIDEQRPFEQWTWHPEYDIEYGAPLGPAVVSNL